jgi:hypothetical protein
MIDSLDQVILLLNEFESESNADSCISFHGDYEFKGTLNNI